MAENVTETTPEQPDTPAPATTATASEATRPRRTVTMPVLPLAIVGAILVALIFFGGGIAVGFAIGHHPARVGVIQPFRDGRNVPFGGHNGFGQNGGQNGGKNGGQNHRATPAPKNG